MKKILYFLCLCFVMTSGCTTIKQNLIKEKISNQTTFIFVRHAEKIKDEKDPGLTREGIKRAENLALMLRDVPVDAVYSSNYKRTLDTAAPTAKYHNLQVKTYNPRDLATASQIMLAAHSSGTILVVGHSNTTPNFVNLLAGEGNAQAIDESEYDNLYFVKYFDADNVEVLHLRF